MAEFPLITPRLGGLTVIQESDVYPLHGDDMMLVVCRELYELIKEYDDVSEAFKEFNRRKDEKIKNMMEQIDKTFNPENGRVFNPGFGLSLVDLIPSTKPLGNTVDNLPMTTHNVVKAVSMGVQRDDRVYIADPIMVGVHCQCGRLIPTPPYGQKIVMCKYCSTVYGYVGEGENWKPMTKEMFAKLTGKDVYDDT